MLLRRECLLANYRESENSACMLNSFRSLQLFGSSVHGILQVSILEWVAISFSRGSSQPRD